MIGPFPRTTPQVFVGESGIDFAGSRVEPAAKPIGWTARLADSTTGRVDLEDLKSGSGDRGGFGYDTTGSPDLSAFGYAEVDSDSEGSALMLLGSSGTLIVTVNEEVVYDYTNSAGRAYAVDTDLVKFPVPKGRNRLLVVSRQGIGRWGFGVQFAKSPVGSNANVARTAGRQGR